MTLRVASLGMYDRPEVQAANDRWWTAIAGRLAAQGVERIPDRLDRGRPLAAIWDDPDLLLAQCCGYPLVTVWRGRLRYVATPLYDVAGCEGSDHRSRIVVRCDDPGETLSDFRGRRAAINEPGSNTGTNLFRAAVAPLAGGQPFFADVTETGSHAASARLVAADGADIAAIDTVSFALLDRHEPGVTAKLRTLGWTEAVPGLPLVTSRSTSRRDLAALRAALGTAATDPALADIRSALFIAGVEQIRPARYDRIVRIEARAQRAGYPTVV